MPLSSQESLSAKASRSISSATTVQYWQFSFHISRLELSEDAQKMAYNFVCHMPHLQKVNRPHSAKREKKN